MKSESNRQLGVLDLAHRFLKAHVKPGDLCIDATAGRGHDTAFLCGLAGETGRVIAFDIQPEAIRSTGELLAAEGFVADLRLDSHENMERYAAAGTVSCVVFNFGWLPGGDHHIYTRAQSSIHALGSALRLLRPGGVLSLCIYYGGTNGVEERDAILEFVRGLDSRFFTVLQMTFPNRTGCAPFACFVIKDCEPPEGETEG